MVEGNETAYRACQGHGVKKLVYLISTSGKRNASKGSWLTYLLTMGYSTLTSIGGRGPWKRVLPQRPEGLQDLCRSGSCPA